MGTTTWRFSAWASGVGSGSAVAVRVGRAVGVKDGRGVAVAVAGMEVSVGVSVEMETTPVDKGAAGETWLDGSAVEPGEGGMAGLTAQAHNPSARSIQVHLPTFRIIAQNRPGVRRDDATCGTICPMQSEQPAPRWLWRLVTRGFALLVVMLVAVAAVLALGAADPPRAGPLLWMDDFKAGSARWHFVTEGASISPHEGALVASLAGNQMATALTARPAGDFTAEMAGAQTTGAIGARYGLVFGWRDIANYCAVLVNGNGYAEAYQMEAGQRRDWFEWQQWPNLLAGTDANRVRADVRGRQITVRVNDEFLVEVTADSTGEIGVLARDSVVAGDDSAAPSQVVISWVKVWGK